MTQKSPILAIHGGAGTILRSSLSAEKEAAYRKALSDALLAGKKILHSGGAALDAVQATVVSLENCPLFNAGRGAVFTNKGTHELDASIMCGKSLNAGAVSGIKSVKNPVSLARAVMQHTEHVFLIGEGAEELGRQVGIEFADDDYFYTEFRHKQWLEIRDSEKFQLDHSEEREKKFGTVGAVALDIHGNLAAATSTGGMTNKKFGRVGDSPMIGAGIYANNKTCAVSCTGHGELFIRAVVAYDISCLMEYKSYSLEQACRTVVMDKLPAIQGEGGVIALDAQGNIQLCYNSEGMYRGWLDEQGNIHTAIFEN